MSGLRTGRVPTKSRDVLGNDIAPRAGMKFPATGLARVLRHHLQATFDEAGRRRTWRLRSFAKHGESVSAAIWQARLVCARRMLGSPAGIGLLIAEIAALSGFREMPTFTRMFKRRYGMTPGDARQD